MLTHVSYVNTQSARLDFKGFVAGEHVFCCILVTSSKVITSRYSLMIERIQLARLLYRFWSWHSEWIDFGVCEVQGAYLTLSGTANILQRPQYKQMHFS